MRGVLYAILAAVVLATGVLGYTAYRTVNQNGGTFGGPFTLTDMYGNEITEKALRGQPVAIYFGFTHCPEVCPTTLYELNGWLSKLGPEGRNIKAFFFTVDPERDSPEMLKDYITNVTDRVVGISGDPAEIAKVIKDYKIYAKKVPTDDGKDYTMDHTASVLLLNANGGFEGTIAYGENPDTAMAKLRRLAAG
ncbi:hypothetical protein CSC94_07680 [Zhengella mangrovi]|uniref:SCO family protein n=1 Tax=Zhengella mangrovi TaxID=1982044 RepID=A0A2G1QRH4_9HYPH|nr:SCO family protein [Zhengella mangrovi]PHP67808.1 hypothetical protein CSC94_07680 [Zhengella mangrovi]